MIYILRCLNNNRSFILYKNTVFIEAIKEMDNIMKYTGIVLAVMAAGMCACAMPHCAPKSIQEGVYDGENFTVVNQRAFEASENVYVRGTPGKSYFKDPVTVYVTNNSAGTWKCGESVEQKGYVRKVTGASVANGGIVSLGTLRRAYMTYS